MNPKIEGIAPEPFKLFIESKDLIFWTPQDYFKAFF